MSDLVSSAESSPIGLVASIRIMSESSGTERKQSPLTLIVELAFLKAVVRGFMLQRSFCEAWIGHSHQSVRRQRVNIVEEQILRRAT